MQSIENQTFKKLIKEVLQCSRLENQIKKKDGNFNNNTLKLIIKDIGETIDITDPISLTAIKKHINNTQFPREETLNFYCAYCAEKGSNWCTKENWFDLLQENNTSEVLVNKTQEPDYTFGNKIDDNNVLLQKELPKNSTIIKLPPTKPMAIFINTWYNDSPYKFTDYNRKVNEGTLFIDYAKDEIRFQILKNKHRKNIRAQKEVIHIQREQISDIFHTKMPGDFSSSWIKIEYANGKEAWFQENPKTGRGIIALFGGSKKLYKALFDFYNTDTIIY